MIYKYCVLVFFFFFHLHRDLEFLIVCLFDNYIRRANIIYKKRSMMPAAHGTLTKRKLVTEKRHVCLNINFNAKWKMRLLLHLEQKLTQNGVFCVNHKNVTVAA